MTHTSFSAATRCAESQFGIIDAKSFIEEEATERRAMRWAIVTAAIAHIALLFVHFAPATQPLFEPKRKAIVHVLRTTRWKQPPLTPTEMRQRLPTIPVPDLDPNDLEPLLARERLQAEPLSVEVIGVAIPEPPPVPQITEPLQVGGNVLPPKKISGPVPLYTEAARRARITGAVTLALIVTRHGEVEDIQVVKGLPLGLTEATVDAVRQWRFAPATFTDGTPVPVHYQLTVQFDLQ